MIINSLLDTDMYKFYMGQYCLKYYPNVKVRYAFTNRTTSVKLAESIDLEQLKKEIFHVSTLRFTFDELQYLRDMNIFSEEYINHLNTLRLPPVFVEVVDGQLKIETTGLWSNAIYWETFILSIVNELYNRQFLLDNDPKRITYNYSIEEYGKNQLNKKIYKMSQNNFQFIEFGTRRRFSHDWQEYVIGRLKMGVNSKSFLGTSNVYFAKQFNIKPIGTFAHELPMVVCGLSPELLKSAHRECLSKWFELYGEKLSIALTDTFGTDFFFKEGIENPKQWKGLRQDSGDVFTFGEKAIKYYENMGVDPKDKMLVFSDGLDVDKIIAIENQFKGRIGLSYGWGTSLTNNCGIKPLSIVMKAVESNGNPLVKLSDNISKASGKSEVIEKYKEVFGYTNIFKEETKY